jgi:hypothetical protein
MYTDSVGEDNPVVVWVRTALMTVTIAPLTILAWLATWDAFFSKKGSLLTGFLGCLPLAALVTTLQVSLFCVGGPPDSWRGRITYEILQGDRLAPVRLTLGFLVGLLILIGMLSGGGNDLSYRMGIDPDPY